MQFFLTSFSSLIFPKVSLFKLTIFPRNKVELCGGKTTRDYYLNFQKWLQLNDSAKIFGSWSVNFLLFHKPTKKVNLQSSFSFDYHTNTIFIMHENLEPFWAKLDCLLGWHVMRVVELHVEKWSYSMKCWALCRISLSLLNYYTPNSWYELHSLDWTNAISPLNFLFCLDDGLPYSASLPTYRFATDIWWCFLEENQVPPKK